MAGDKTYSLFFHLGIGEEAKGDCMWDAGMLVNLTTAKMNWQALCSNA
jgi:hypothetical protein